MFVNFEFFANWLRARFGDDDRGASLVEYALLIALLALVCITAITLVGKNSSSKLNDMGTSLAAN